MKNNIDISIIIVSYNTKDLLRSCVESVIKNITSLKYEIIIVDNDSQDGSKTYIKEVCKKNKNVKCFFMDKNIGFGGANNFGMNRSSGSYILLLNSDIQIENNVIEKVIEWMRNNPGYGVASANLYNPDGSIQGTGGYFPTILSVFSWMTIQDLPFVDDLIKPFHPMKGNSPFSNSAFYNKDRDLDWVTGAFFMMRREVFENVGGFDTDFFMYTEDVEYCVRIKAQGWFVRYLPYKGVTHLGGASGNMGDSILKEFEGVKLLYKKHYPGWQYPILRVILKIGCLWRMFLMGILKGRKVGLIYAKAFLKT